VFPFSRGRGATHPKIFNCSSEPLNIMTFEMGKDNQAVGGDSFPCYSNGSEMLPVNPNLTHISAKKSLSNNDRAPVTA